MSGTVGQLDSRSISKADYNYLHSKLKNVENKQGILGKTWNEIKEFTNLGVSESDCESMLKKYQNGQISFEEAVDYINGFEQKQDDIKELAKNVITGVGAIAAATMCVAGGPIGWGVAAAVGAPVGAAVKTALGIADRATNNVKDDEFDTKELAKDVVSGAVTGMTSAVSSGVGKGIKAGNMGTSVKNGIVCGLECGAISGSTSYLTDVALDENKEFNFGDLTRATATSSLVSGTVGGIVGAGLYGNAAIKGKVGENAAKKTVEQTIAADSASSTTRKLLGKGVRKLSQCVA